MTTIKKITLIKLGGSLITDKHTPYTLRPRIIDRILLEIRDVVNEYPHEIFLLGNGAGSFAHQSAKKYNTIHGFSDQKGAYGACLVHQDAIKLNSILVEKSLVLGLPVFSLHPSSFMNASNTKDHTIFPDIFIQLLTKKIIPFIYGDVIIDDKIGSTIFSTDRIFRIIAKYLASKNYSVRILHVGDYDGVNDQEGNVIPEITSKSFPQMNLHFEKNSTVDVTGGMKGKVFEMLALAKIGITSNIINGTVDGGIKKALTGVPIGTRIIPQKLS